MTLLPPDILATEPPPAGAIYGLGTFDGVHRGHLHLIDRVTQLGKILGLPAWVLVLYRDPANPLFAGQQVITTIQERDWLFHDSPLDGASTLRLSREVTDTAHDAFVRDVLLGQLKARHLVVGWDFHYGHARVGNVTLLQNQLQQSSAPCGLTVLDPVMDGAEPIKSTTIRELLIAGDVVQANRWLTRPYFMSGLIESGRQQGRELGFPTANLSLPATKLRPGHGVYVTVAELDGERYWAATNVGVRPTIDGASTTTTVEAHLLDVDRDLYGQAMVLHFLGRLRDEQRFASLEALRDQLQCDISAVRAYSAAHDLRQLPLVQVPWPIGAGWPTGD